MNSYLYPIYSKHSVVLYLVATPIGNLADMTQRAVAVLSACNYILCEDTRHSKILLSHYNIQKPLVSYHKFNEASREQELIADLKQGQEIALISDAGTPGIADPGERLVRGCVDAGVQVISIPGACAAIAALTCSGLSTSPFQFVGFLPRKASELKRQLIDILRYCGTTICYEAPHRLIELLEALALLAPKRRLVVARELTKKFETVLRGTAQDILEGLKRQAPKGELVVLVEGQREMPSWEGLTPENHVALVEQEYHLTRMEAIKLVAELRGLAKRDLYRLTHDCCTDHHRATEITEME